MRKLKFIYLNVDNIVGKGENAGYQHNHSPLPRMFSKVLLIRGRLRS